MNRAPKFARRIGAAAVTTIVALGLSAGVSYATAPAAVPPTVPPIADRTATGVTADALPTVQIDGVVWSQAIVGNTVYAGGEFTNARPAGAAAGVDQTPVYNLIAYNLTTGAMDPSFVPDVNGEIKAVVASPDGSRVYIGGSFTSVNGSDRYRIAAFDTATGQLDTSFQPGVDATVNSLSVTNTTVYAGGIFSMANGNARTRLAAFNAADGALLGWAPTVADTLDAPAKSQDNVNALQLTPDDTHVVVGGAFTSVNGAQALGLASVDATTGALAPFTVNQTVKDYGTGGAILSLSTDGTSIYGTGYTFGSGNFEGTFSADPTTGAINWLEDCHGDTYGAYASSTQVYVVSHEHYCSGLGGFPETTPRTSHRTTAFTVAATGKLLPNSSGSYASFTGQPSPSLVNWFPDLIAGTYTKQDQAAWTVTGNSQYVVEGGEFPTVNGIPQQGLVRFAVPSLAPNKSGPVDRTGVVTATATSDTTATVSWPTNWDRDDQNLTYTLTHVGSTTPIYTTSAVSQFWNRPTLTYSDTGLLPGTTYAYKVVASDPNGNTIATYSPNITTTGTSPTPPPAAATTTTITTSPSNPVVGQVVTATISVQRTDNGTAASGSVGVSIDGGTAQTVSLAAGSAQVTTTFAASGNHTVSASFAGTASFAASSSSATVTVVAAATTTTITTSPANPVAGQAVTADVAVQRSDNNTAASGSVNVSIDGAAAKTLTLNAGHAQVSTTFATAGSHTVAATFTGNATYTTSAATTSITVRTAATTTTITPSPTTPIAGQAVTLDVSVQRTDNGSPATGTVSVTVDGAAAQTLPLSAGHAQLSTTFATSGAHTISAAFASTASLAASSAATTVTVQTAPTTTTITPTPANPVAGQSVTADISVQRSDVAAPASGSVNVSIDGGAAQTLTLSAAGHAQVSTTFATPGTHTIAATYAGTTAFAASSATSSVTVLTAATATTVTMTPANPVVGQAVTATMSVQRTDTKAPVSGTIGVSVDGGTSQSLTLTNGQAQLSTTFSTPGTHTVTAQFAATALLAGSTRSSSVTVSKDATTTTAVVSPTTPVTGQRLSVRSTVATVKPGTASPTGSVTVSVDGKAGKPSTLTSARATTAVSGLAAGRHTLKVSYSGDSTHSASTWSRTITVAAGRAAARVTSSSKAPKARTTIRFTARLTTVAPAAGTPTGSVAFYIDGHKRASETVQAGAASYTVRLKRGRHKVVAVYAGSTSFAKATSTAMTQTVR